jgi:Undecaprenyl-phosphate glucose phosphotransferase
MVVRFSDAVGAVIAAVVARQLAGPDATWALFLLAPPMLFAGLTLGKLYRFGREESLVGHLGRLSLALAGAAVLSATVLAPVSRPDGLGVALMAWAAPSLAILAGLHAAWWLAVRHWRDSGRLTPNIVVVGATGAAERLIAHAVQRRDANILGVFDDRLARTPGDVGGVPVLGDTRRLVDHRIMPFVDRVVITVPSGARTRVAQLVARLRVLPNEVVLLLDGQDAAAETAALSRAADVPLAHISGPPVDDARAVAKRAQDLVIGATALLLAAPLMLVLAIAVRLDSPGPILFRQRRHGFNNEEIVVWKFRSMRADAADLTASRQVVVDDDRVTRLGRLMRRTSLDELPQIINVLKGEMSLVGPRPHAVGMKTGEVESARLVAEYAHRHRMKPGVTGWAAIKGSRGPVDTPESVRLRVALDIEYIERQSFWLDVYILAMTLPCLIGDRQAVR